MCFEHIWCFFNVALILYFYLFLFKFKPFTVILFSFTIVFFWSCKPLWEWLTLTWINFWIYSLVEDSSLFKQESDISWFTCFYFRSFVLIIVTGGKVWSLLSKFTCVFPVRDTFFCCFSCARFLFPSLRLSSSLVLMCTERRIKVELEVHFSGEQTVAELLVFPYFRRVTPLSCRDLSLCVVLRRCAPHLTLISHLARRLETRAVKRFSNLLSAVSAVQRGGVLIQWRAAIC